MVIRRLNVTKASALWLLNVPIQLCYHQSKQRQTFAIQQRTTAREQKDEHQRLSDEEDLGKLQNAFFHRRQKTPNS
jgi:hypothetical protein